MSAQFKYILADYNGTAKTPYDANGHLYKIKLFDLEYAKWGMTVKAMQPAISKVQNWLESVHACGLHIELLELDKIHSLNIQIDPNGDVVFYILEDFRDSDISPRCIWTSMEWKADVLSDNYDYVKDRNSELAKYRTICWMVVLHKWDAFRKAVSEAMMENHPELLDMLGLIEHFDDEQQKTSASE